MYYLIFFASVVTLIIYKRKDIVENYRNFKKINNLIERTTNKNIISTFFASLKIALEIFLIYILQKINKTVVKLDKNNYEIIYTLNNKLYKFRVKKQKGPSKVLQIIDNKKSQDITDKLLP